MRALARLVLACLVIAALVGSAIAAPTGPQGRPEGPKGKPKKVFALSQGGLFCPGRPLRIGAIVIRTGRCYTVMLLRDRRGTFLAFVAPRSIPPGQLVRMNTPAGAKLKGRIFYLVPVSTGVALIPFGSARLVAVQVQDFGPTMVFLLQGVPAPSVFITFQVLL